MLGLSTLQAVNNAAAAARERRRNTSPRKLTNNRWVFGRGYTLIINDAPQLTETPLLEIEYVGDQQDLERPGKRKWGQAFEVSTRLSRRKVMRRPELMELAVYLDIPGLDKLLNQSFGRD